MKDEKADKHEDDDKSSSLSWSPVTTTIDSAHKNLIRQGPSEKERRKRHGARNQHRHRIFAKWLEERFPESFRISDVRDNKGEAADVNDTAANQILISPHILDVAGGKGELTARLCLCLQQRVVMVDPRPADIANCYETLVLPKIPNKWQQRVWDQKAKNPDFIPELLHHRFCQLITTFDETTLENSVELQHAVKNASLLIGLHADGATEAILDAALKHQKPFAVVPCCVFPSLFPQRRVVMKEGEPSVPVRIHEQFCQFLYQKHADFQMEVLPFEGRNVAIWWAGPEARSKQYQSS